MRKALQNAVAFARWCERYKCDPADVAKLREHIDRGARAYERDDKAAEHRHADECRKLADKLGFDGIDWPGLYPTLHKDGDECIMVPHV